MVEVATGGNTGEQLPMVLKVPHFSDEPMMACYNPYSMLGFGDILVPGLLISFCHAFDLQKGSRCWTYWFTTTLCYTLGMGATFISLFVMNSAQPALLYLVPFTLIPLFVVAGICGDFGAMWKGDYVSS
jgi:signal peptide peptidase-like protein 2B